MSFGKGSNYKTDYSEETCPSGYILVPGDSVMGTSDFCVMQFEAKAWLDSNGDSVVDSGEVDTDGCLEPGCSTANWGTSTYKPGSTEEGKPWGMLDFSTAQDACQSLGSSYDLISNVEWMTIARNIEDVASNWSGGSVGSGCIFQGNLGVAGTCAYNHGANLVDSGSNRNSLAKLTLSNGNTIWDFSGNAVEWADWLIGSGVDGLNPACDSGAAGANWLEFSAVSCAGLESTLYSPKNTSYTSANGIGKFEDDSLSGILRGGGVTFGTSEGGIYSLLTDIAATLTSNLVGFRCVYRY